VARRPADDLTVIESEDAAMPGAGNSRRITEDHRLVFLVDGDDVVIEQARYHYWCAAR